MKPETMRTAMDRYQKSRGWDYNALCRWLVILPVQGRRLGLCQRPLPDDLDYDAQIKWLAEYGPCDECQLRMLLEASDD